MKKIRQFTTILLITCGLLISTSFGQSKERNKTEAEQIDSTILKFLEKRKFAGVSVAVMRGDTIVFDKAYGRANVEHEVPANPKTIYRVGSLGKSVTAAAIMYLAEQGKLSINDVVGKFLPSYPSPGNAVTIRHLLNMTSGIPNYTENEKLDKFREGLSHDELLSSTLSI